MQHAIQSAFALSFYWSKNVLVQKCIGSKLYWFKIALVQNCLGTLKCSQIFWGCPQFFVNIFLGLKNYVLVHGSTAKFSGEKCFGAHF